MPTRLLSVGLVILLLLLLYALLGGQRNVSHLFKQREKLAQLQEENRALRERNEELHADVNDIKTDLGAIDSKARSELGLIKPGETFYQIVTE